MKTCDDLPGRLRDLCHGKGFDGRPDPRLQDIQEWRDKFIADGVELPELDIPKLIRRQQSTTREKVGTALKSRIEGLLKIKSGKGCGCTNLASQMDGWGITGCERERETIVSALVKNRPILADALKERIGVMNIALHAVPDSVLRIGANWLLDKAIEDVKTPAQKKPAPPVPAPRPQRSVSNNRVEKHLHAVKSNQKKLYNDMLLAPKPDSDPFTDTPVFHFGAHLWPIEGHWEHHVDKWNDLADKITGKCIVGIAECTGCGTSPTSEVAARLSSRFETFTVPNTKSGENPTFEELLRRMPTGDNDVFLYAHGKGVKPATRVSPAVKQWVRIMYETVIFNHREIVRRFAQGYRTFGSLRAFGPYPLRPKYNWHYAGTFFAIRSKYLPGTHAVKAGYGGVEAWPGNYFQPNMAWCEFGENRVITSHYNDAEMTGKDMQKKLQEKLLSYRGISEQKNLIAVTTCNLHDNAQIKRDIKTTLDSIKEHSKSDVIVVDDGSPPDYQLYVSGLCEQHGFRFLPQAENGGISVAKNVCLTEFLSGNHEYCFLLDDDVKVISPDLETKYIEAMEQSNVGILSWNDPHFTGTKPEPAGRLVSTHHTCGCCVVLSRECAQSTGQYDVMPGKWGSEHSAYFRRAVSHGFAPRGGYYDIADSASILSLVSHASVYTFQQKEHFNSLNQIHIKQQEQNDRSIRNAPTHAG
jgi:hypothetical protein